MRTFLPLVPAALLAACGPNDTDAGPGGVTVAEARALDEAAEMIDARRLPSEAVEDAAPVPTASPATVPAPAQ